MRGNSILHHAAIRKIDFIRMKLSEIQKIILKWTSNNYAATEIIRQSVCDDLGRAISDESFSTALFGLHSRRFVASYIYDHQSEGYASIISPDEYSVDVLYWLATEKAGQ